MATSCLVTTYNNPGTPSLQFWRSIFARRAPENYLVSSAWPRYRSAKGTPLMYEVSDNLLVALTDVYREAASGKIGG